MARLVNFVGKADSLELHIDANAAFEEVVQKVNRKLEESGSFFAGSPSIHVVGKVTPDQQDELVKLLRDGYGFKQVSFAGNATAQASEQRGPAVPIPLRNEEIQEAAQQSVRLRTAKRKETPPARREPEVMMPLQTEKEKGRRTSGRDGNVFTWGVPKQAPLKLRNDVQNVRENHVIMVYDTVHSGQCVAYDGDIVVLGDVNQGAELIASGSIVVMGVLRGMAHAGSAGDETASVSANRLMPQQLRIGAQLAVAPDDIQVSAADEPERAFVEDDQIVVKHLGQKRTRKKRVKW